MFEKFVSKIKSTANTVGDMLSSRNNLDLNIRDQYSKITNFFSDTDKLDAVQVNFPPRRYTGHNSGVYLDLSWPKEHNADHSFDTFTQARATNKDTINIQKRRTDREEIRRRLAMGPEPDNYPNSRASRKQSLQSRLQSGMNLQICFMNDNISDSESPTLELISQDNLNVNVRPETTTSLTVSLDNQVQNIDAVLHNRAVMDLNDLQDNERPATLAIGPPPPPKTEQDFFACQARLQVEARLALAQAKQMAHMQMELERQKQISSPITDVIRTALITVGATSPDRHRRLSRRLLTSMTVAQLQVVVCRLHTQVELFNEQLVKLLMNRDELHMSQDSMLVDIEDLTRYL